MLKYRKADEDIINDKEELPVVFEQIMFKYNYTPGSFDSLELHKALEMTETDAIFETKCIQAILKYKWGQVKWISFFQGFVMFTYLVTILLHFMNPDTIIYIGALGVFIFYFSLEKLF
jgi:hypothetical protein